MAMINAKSIRTALKTFSKENGRDPNVEEFRNLINGRPAKKKKAVQNANESEAQA